MPFLIRYNFFLVNSCNCVQKCKCKKPVSGIIEILAKRSMAQLWAAFQTYDVENKSASFSVDVQNRFSGPFRDALVALGIVFIFSNKELSVGVVSITLTVQRYFISRLVSLSLSLSLYLPKHLIRERERERERGDLD